MDMILTRAKGERTHEEHGLGKRVAQATSLFHREFQFLTTGFLVLFAGGDCCICS